MENERPLGLGPTIDELLQVRALSHADHVFLRFADGDLTFSEVDARATRLAQELSTLGVMGGDIVPVLMTNSADFVVSVFALCRAGATACLINSSFRGSALHHAITVTDAHIALVDPATAPQLAQISDDLARRPTPVIVADVWNNIAELDVPAPEATRPATEPAVVLFTSGTTGRSKGCVLSHRYVVRQAEMMVEHLGFVDSDVFYCPFPLFHIDALVLTVGPALVLGATAAIGTRFSVSGFWPEVHEFGATVFDFMGATLTMLHKADPAGTDATNPIRLAWGVPVPDEIAEDFERRFDLRLIELYGSTDAGVPIYHPLDRSRRPGSCGLVTEAYHAELHDADGFAVATGQTGELVLRPTEPSIMADGYLAMPEATLTSRHNMWFHTGDQLRQDHDGYFYFVGRNSDTIRRRGENISAFEVEEVIKFHPDVLDAAAFGVPSELTEEDLMAAVVLRPGAVLSPAELAEFCAQRAARHMVPRYVDIVDELPRTPTEKVRKEVLRTSGVTPTTWDSQRPRQPE